MHRKFARNYDSLKDIYEFTESVLDAGDIEQSVRYPVHFVVEELFTNMVKHNPENDQDISLEVEANGRAVTVTIIDYDVDAFDVTADRKVDTTSTLRDRKVGGLGLHLIRYMVDSLKYHYANRETRITFTKGMN